MNARRLVRAVFRPHDREDSEFSKTRFAAKQFLYSLEFLLREVMGGDNFGSNHQEVLNSLRPLRISALIRRFNAEIAEIRRGRRGIKHFYWLSPFLTTFSIAARSSTGLTRPM